MNFTQMNLKQKVIFSPPPLSLSLSLALTPSLPPHYPSLSLSHTHTHTFTAFGCYLFIPHLSLAIRFSALSLFPMQLEGNRFYTSLRIFSFEKLPPKAKFIVSNYRNR